MTELILPILIGAAAAIAALLVRRTWGGRVDGFVDFRYRLSTVRSALATGARRLGLLGWNSMRLLVRGTRHLFGLAGRGVGAMRSRLVNSDRQRLRRSRDTAGASRVPEQVGDAGTLAPVRRPALTAPTYRPRSSDIDPAAWDRQPDRNVPLVGLGTGGRPLIAVGPGKPRKNAPPPELSWRASDPGDHNPGWWRRGGEDCPECAAARQRGARYCIRCGRPVEQVSDPIGWNNRGKRR